MVERVATAVTEPVVVTEIETAVTVIVVVVIFHVDGNVLVNVHGIRHRVSDRDLDGHFDWIGHGHVLLDVHGIRDGLFDGHRIGHVLLDRHDNRSVHQHRHLFGHVDGLDVTVTVVRSQQAVAGQTVPVTVAAVSVTQTPQAAFALFLLGRRFFIRLFRFGTDQHNTGQHKQQRRFLKIKIFM